MNYKAIARGAVDWQLYCKKEEIERLSIAKHLHRNQKKWETPEIINVYVDTQYPEHPDIDFDNPILRNTMIWANGGGSYIGGRKGATTPFIIGTCFSKGLYHLMLKFRLTDEQFLELNVHNFQKNSELKYFLYYPTFKPYHTRLIDFKTTEFIKKVCYSEEIVGVETFELELEYRKQNLAIMMEGEFEYKPKKLGIISNYDFCFDGFNYIVSERLKSAIEAAGMDDVYFYDLDYEVLVPDMV